MDEFTFVVSVSGAIYASIEALKKVKPEWKKSKWMEVLPLAIGATYGAASGPLFMEMHALQTMPVGILAGSLSAVSYRMIKRFVVEKNV